MNIANTSCFVVIRVIVCLQRGEQCLLHRVCRHRQVTAAEAHPALPAQGLHLCDRLHWPGCLCSGRHHHQRLCRSPHLPKPLYQPLFHPLYHPVYHTCLPISVQLVLADMQCIPPKRMCTRACSLLWVTLLRWVMAAELCSRECVTVSGNSRQSSLLCCAAVHASLAVQGIMGMDIITLLCTFDSRPLPFCCLILLCFFAFLYTQIHSHPQITV